MPSITGTAKDPQDILAQKWENPPEIYGGNTPIFPVATGEPNRDEANVRARLEEWAIIARNLEHGFTQVPDEIRRDPTLSRSAKLVYEQLLSYMWRQNGCWPSQETIAREIATISRRTVIRALNELYRKGYIETYRRGLGRTNVYFVNPLSFVKSFRQSQVAQICLDSITFYANDPLKQVCHFDTPRSDKSSQQEVPFWHTNYTKDEQNQSEYRNPNSSGSAENSEVRETQTYSHIAHETIRRSKEERGTDKPNKHTIPQNSKNRKASGETTPARQGTTETDEEAAPAIDTSGARTPRRLIGRFLEQYSIELGDELHTESNKKQACNIFEARAIWQEDSIIGALLRAFKEARKVPDAEVKKRNGGGGANRMPLFFHALRKHARFDPASRDSQEQEEEKAVPPAPPASDPPDDQKPEPAADDQEPQARISHQRTYEQRQTRQEYAHKKRFALIYAGVPDAHIRREHSCGCPVYYPINRAGDLACVHCAINAYPDKWPDSAVELVMSIMEQ